MKVRSAISVLAGLLVLGLASTACNIKYDEETPVETVYQNPDMNRPTALFNPDPHPGPEDPEAFLPFPNDMLRTAPIFGKQLSLPVQEGDSEAVADLIGQLNHLDGFSLTPEMYVDFDMPIDERSISPASVMLLAGDELEQLEYSWAVSETVSGRGMPIWRLTLRPTARLKEHTAHFLVVTEGVTGGEFSMSVQSAPVFYMLKNKQPLISEDSTESLISVLDPPTARQLEVIRQVYYDFFNRIESNFGLARNDIAVFGHFTTLRATKDLNDIREYLLNEYTPAVTDIADEVTFDSVAPADAYYTAIGQSGLPHSCLQAVANGSFQPRDFRNTEEGLIGAEIAGTPYDLDFLLAYPSNDAGCAGYDRQRGAPLVIFVHAITGYKEHLLALANVFAEAGYASVAVDMVEHCNVEAYGDDGCTASGRPLTDLLGSGIASGDAFINPLNWLATRDNLRQSVADILWLYRTFRALRYSAAADQLPLGAPDGRPDIDGTDVTLVGHSLGGVAAALALAVEPQIPYGIINAAGGDFRSLLLDSQLVAQRLKPEMSVQLDLPLDSAEFIETYQLLADTAQWVLESADPVNFANAGWAGELAEGNRGLLMQQILGDEVMPDSSSNALADALGLTAITSTTSADAGYLSALVPFAEGEAVHTNVLAPHTDPTGVADYAFTQAYLEMQNEVRSYLSSGGNSVTITSPGLLAE